MKEGKNLWEKNFQRERRFCPSSGTKCNSYAIGGFHLSLGILPANPVGKGPNYGACKVDLALVVWPVGPKQYIAQSDLPRNWAWAGPLYMTYVDAHFCDTFSTNPIQPSSITLWIKFFYFIIFYPLKAWPRFMQHMGEIEEMWFGGYDRVGFFRTFCISLAHVCYKWARNTVSTFGLWRRSDTWNFQLKELLYSGCLWPKVSTLNHFCL